jgi:Amt family ammonium transporter
MVIGYSLTFGRSNGGIIGGFNNAFFLNVSIDSCNYSLAPNIPEILFAAFQMMFALMTPVIVTGAWAERMKFEAFICFTILWPFLVYYPLAHWIWNPDGWLNKLGVKDFAGGCVIHASTGIAALVVCTFLSSRERSKTSRRTPPHNLLLSMLGSSLIWGGWYSFNGGSAYAANSQASNALINTHLAACAGSFVWVVIGYHRDKRYHLLELMSGALAGLGSITAGSGFVAPASAFLIGAVGAGLSNCWVYIAKPRLKLDDTLDVMGLQGIPGITGSFLLAFFSRPDSINGVAGIVYGGSWNVLGVQCLAIVSTVIISAFGTWIVMLLTRAYLGGLDISAADEEAGLDECQIGEQAYDMKLPPVLDIGEDALLLKLNEACLRGDLVKAKSLINDGADPQGVDYDGRSPAHLAAAEGHLDIIKYLIEYHQINVNTEDRFGNTLLAEAIQHSQRHICEYLQKRGDATINKGKGYVENVDIFHAASVGNLDQLVYFVQHAHKECADPNDMAGKTRNHEHVVNQSDYDKRFPLHIACAEGHVEVVDYLVKHGAKLDVKDRWGNTPLDEAIKYKHDDVVRVLRASDGFSHRTSSEDSDRLYPASSEENDEVLSVGDDVTTSRSSSHVSSINTDLKSILVLAKSPTSVYTPLLDNDSSISNSKSVSRQQSSIKNKKKSALMSSSSKSFNSTCAVDKMDTSTRMLLQASEEGHLEEVETLLKKGTNPLIGDYDNRTALHIGMNH